MRKTSAALAVLCTLALAGCGSETTTDAQTDTSARTAVAATTTASAGPLTRGDVEAYQSTLNTQVQACVTPADNMFSMGCTKAIYAMVDTLEEFDSRLTSAYPKTRASVTETISNLEYWRDQCMTTKANSPERRACIPYMVTEGGLVDPIAQWASESR
ncbi:MAG: hypothetical protein EOP24_39720 [Hyphomicrobiales bacterium]|nr:MAG: hypothetical protein EOP24_39720 [Hyphomicrobiales bacterium]